MNPATASAICAARSASRAATSRIPATSQFYVNLADNVDLNPRPTRWGYAVFGKVVEGMEVVDDIGHRPTAGGGPFDRNVPVEPIVIERIELIE